MPKQTRGDASAPGNGRPEEARPPAVLTWTQVHAWRLARHHLDARAPHAAWPAVVSALGGLHAQMMSAAELALWARVADVTPDTVREALWQTRTLLKTWAMRGTLHLIPASDYPLLVGALRTRQSYRTAPWLKYHHLTLADVEASIAGVQTALTGRCLTREELAVAVASETARPHLQERLLSGWGELLKPAAYQGFLCFGPSQGATVTFVRPADWIGAWAPVDSAAALPSILRRFLRAYGPANRDELARWWGVQPAAIRPALAALAPELAAVTVEGWQGWALTETLLELTPAAPTLSVRLLPHFDPYVVGLAPQIRRLLPAEYHPRIFRQSGWISPVLLVGGEVAGTWEYEKRRGRIAVQISPFAPLGPAVAAAAAAEADRLGRFLDAPVQVSYV